MKHVLFGIDYGSKLSGNTVVAVLNINKIYFLRVEENTDADVFIINATAHFKPSIIFIDAPLSLPGILCCKSGFADYHYRQADKELCAMSPMFLGGLTARAMQLRATLQESYNTKVYETCPKAQARNFKLEDLGYKKEKSNLNTCRSFLVEKLNPALLIDCNDIESWHHLDALLALFGAMRFVSGNALPYGHPKEGIVYV